MEQSPVRRVVPLMNRTSTAYRGYRLDFESFGGMVLVQIVSTTSPDRYLLSGSTLFGTAEQAFDLIDDLHAPIPGAPEPFAPAALYGERSPQAV